MLSQRRSQIRCISSPGADHMHCLSLIPIWSDLMVASLPQRSKGLWMLRGRIGTLSALSDRSSLLPQRLSMPVPYNEPTGLEQSSNFQETHWSRENTFHHSWSAPNVEIAMPGN